MNVSDKFTKRVIYSIDANELDSIIKNLYGRDPDIEVNEELYESSLEVDPDFDKHSWHDFTQDEIYPGLPTILGKLIKDGHIEDGEFIISSTD